MKKGSIQVSEKHGLNPSMCLCPICKKEIGVAILGKLKGDIEAPKYIVGRKLCDECKKQVDNGKMFFIEVFTSFTGEIIGHTGRVVSMSKEDAKQLLKDDEIAIGYIYVKQNDFEHLFNNIINSQKDDRNSKAIS